MELKDAKSLTEAQVSKKLDEIRTSLPERKLRDVLEWIIKIPKSHPKLFPEVAATLGKISEQTVDVSHLEKIIVFFKNNLEKCEGACVEHFVFVSFIVHAQEAETLDGVAGEVLQRVQDATAKNDNTAQVMASLLKSRIVPKLKEMAETKNYTNAFAVWRAIVRTTKLKITTSITNDVLQIATMAFKENNPEYHALAFKSWKILIENLPPDVLRKPAYIRLVLNPLNRTYRDTDANSTVQKYIAWWQHVITLGEDAELSFDEVVVPLLQKVFCMPSAKARQVNPTAFANPTRTIPQCAYTILALLWYNGHPDLRQELQQLGHPNFNLNEHSFKVSCLAKHFNVFDDAITLIVNNIAQKVCVPPKEYPFLLCRILLSRIGSFYENDHHDMVRMILSTVYSILKTKLDLEQTLKTFQDLADNLPSRVMSSSQFNFRKGSFSMHECPVLTFTSFYIRHVAEICHAAGGDVNRKKFRHGLKTLLDKGSKNMNVLRFLDHVLVSLQDVDTLEAESWQEVSAFLSSFIEQTIGSGGKLERDSGAIPSALAFPMRNSFPLTAGVTKSWIELLTTTMKANARLKDVAPNRHLAEICNRAHEQIIKSDYDLNRLLLISQMMESLVKHCDLQFSSTPSDTTPTRRSQKLANLESLVKCLIAIIRKGCEQLEQEKQPKSACQFYVNVVEMVHTLLRDSRDLCREFVQRLVPELVPILELTADRTTMRNSPLFHVESAFLTAVDHVLYALKNKSSDLPKRDESLSDVIRLIVKKLTNHWKASINETVQELAKVFSITPEKRTQPKRSLFGAIDAQTGNASPSKKSVEASPAKTADESQPERKWTRSTPDASALKNGSARDKVPSKPVSAAKKKSKVAPEDEFVPIMSTKKKSEILTEHQLEKLKEKKIIPSMYEDLSQSSQGTFMRPPTKLTPETKAHAEDAEVSAPKSTQNGSNNGRPSTRDSNRRSAPLTRKPGPRKVMEQSSSDDNLEFAFSGNSRENSPENEISSTKAGAPARNGDNNDLHGSQSAVGRPQSPETAVSSQEDATQRVPDPESSTGHVSENAEKPKGALKRKLGRPTHSPIAKKLRPKRSGQNPSKTGSLLSRSKLDAEHPVEIDNDSVMDTGVKPDAGEDVQKPNLTKKSLSSGQGLKADKPPKPSPVKVEAKRKSSFPKSETAEKVGNDALSSPPSENGGVSQQSLVSRIKEAVGHQREGVLKFISSPEFLQSMTNEERRAFLSSFFKNVTDYIL